MIGGRISPESAIAETAECSILAELLRPSVQILLMCSRRSCQNVNHLSYEIMGYKVLPATTDDFKFFVPPLFKAMGSAGFVRTLWPDNETERGQTIATERFLAEL